MANLKDLLVTGVARFLGTVQAKLFKGNLEGNASSATNADTVDGVHANEFIKGSADGKLCTSIDSNITPGTYAVNVTQTTDLPTTYGSWGILDVRVYGNTIAQTIIFTDVNITITRTKIVGQTDWTSFIKFVSDSDINSSWLSTSGGTLNGDLHMATSHPVYTRHVDANEDALFLNWNNRDAPIYCNGPNLIIHSGNIANYLPTSLPANGGNCDTIGGLTDAYHLGTLSAEGVGHGAGYLLQCIHNAFGDGRFGLQVTNWASGIRVDYATTAETATNATNADALGGFLDAYHLGTLSAGGAGHGVNFQLNCQHNVFGDGRFTLQIANRSHEVRVDYATSAVNADTVDNVHISATDDALAGETWLAAFNTTTLLHAISPARAVVGRCISLRTESNYYDIFSTTLSNAHACWNKWCYVVGNSTSTSSADYIANAPESSSALWYEVITGGVASGSRGFQIAIGCFRHQNSVHIRFRHDSAWSSWTKIV